MMALLSLVAVDFGSLRILCPKTMGQGIRFVEEIVPEYEDVSCQASLTFTSVGVTLKLR